MVGQGSGQEPEATGAPDPGPDSGPDSGPKKPRRRGRARAAPRDRALGLRLFLVLLAFALIAAGFSLKIRPLNLPTLIVAEVEDRLNRISQPVLPGARISLGGIDLMLDDAWSPVLRLQDLRVLQGAGTETVLALPEAELALDASAALRGSFLPRRLKLSGAQLDLRRDREGRIDLVLGQGAAPAIRHLGDVFDGLDLALALPELAALEAVEFDALSLSLHDEALQKTWVLGDGRLVAENRASALAAELSVSFLDLPGANARLTVVSDKGSGSARLRAEITALPAAELAAQHPVLAWMKALQAPISGQIAMTLERGGLREMDSTLTIGKGALQPGPEAAPVAFSGAGLSLSYDGPTGQLSLRDLEVQSASVRAKASGQVYLLDGAGQILKGVLSGRAPAAYLGQLTLTDVRIDPQGQFVAPVTFAQGALDLRLTADPFVLEIGQLSLSDGAQRLTLAGRASAGPGGWSAALDLAVNQMTAQRMVQLWPLNLVPRTRAWAASNLLSGDLNGVNAALRLSPGQAPRMHLDFDFAGAGIRFMTHMPPVLGGRGHAVIDGAAGHVALTRGVLRAPQGGVIDLSGSAMRIADIHTIPAVADITLQASGPALAMLSVLDQKPLQYLQKAGRPVALGTGQTRLQATIRTPLSKAVTQGEVSFAASAQVAGFRSDVLVEGRVLQVPDLTISADRSGLTASGTGSLDGLPFAAEYHLPFGAGAGVARVTGSAEVSERAAATFGLDLPEGMVRGASTGQFTLALPKDAPAELGLTSDLAGTRLAIPELGWDKPADIAGALTAEVLLTSPPQVRALSLSAPGLSASGSVSLNAEGGLARADLDNVTMGGWLDGALTITGGTPLEFAVTSGSIDFREFPGPEQRGASGGGAASGSPLSLALSEFRVTDSIRLNDMAGNFTLTEAGAEGQFTALLGGAVAIAGGVAPSPHGTAVRVISGDAGGAMRAAGIFDTALEGALDLTLTPRAEVGTYVGRAEIDNIRVIGGNVLADLLNAVSVIGLLEQLNGEGIVFAQAEADLIVTPDEVTVTRSSAVGASMGVSMEGTYQTGSGALRMGGVISPIYILNGIGAVLTRKGEGLFGFTYRLGGTSDAPEIGVNPLSILTPGMFRDIFRMPAAPEKPVAP